MAQQWHEPMCRVQDPRKFARATELLRMNEEIKQAKKVGAGAGVPNSRLFLVFGEPLAALT